MVCTVNVTVLSPVYVCTDRDSPGTASGEEDTQPPAAKRSKLEDAGPSLETATVSSTGIKADTEPTASFYLTKVRGIPDRYNSSSLAIGIKGMWNKQ